VDERALARLRDEPIDWRYKAFPPAGAPVTPATVRHQGWNLLRGDLPLPALVLKESALARNIALMAEWCRDRGVLLAPHGKTTMAPELFRRQLQAGAWAITVANLAQVRICRAFGVPRILLANELIEPVALRWIAEELAADSAFEFFCLVDSAAGAVAMTEALSAAHASRRLPVLVELGFEGGRAGCRSREEVADVVAAVRRSPALELVGVEAYEGIIHAADVDATLAAVDAFTRHVRATAEELALGGAFGPGGKFLFTLGGSAFFDRVLAQLALPWPDDFHVDIVLRCGSYVSHDSVFYEAISPLAGRADGGARLLPAFEAWGVVLSRPESELAIVGFGKRDVPHDMDLPIPSVVSRGGVTRSLAETMAIADLNDQHAYLRLPSEDPLDVGDLVGCGICHPCTAFDKWRLIPVVDDSYTVTDAVHTFF
jgi:D-serine deaminase-like pyridoxal phosphate-dependent protein